MGLGVGFFGGGAYKHPFFEEAKLKMEAERTRMMKEKMANDTADNLAKDMELGKASIPYYQEKLNEWSQGYYKELGDWMTKNRGFENDPEKRLIWKQKTQMLRNHDFIRQSEYLQEQGALLNDAWGKNPDLMNQPEFRDQFINYNNAVTKGSADGVEENRSPYTFKAVDPWKDIATTAHGYIDRVTRRRYVEDESGYGEKLYDEDLEMAAAYLSDVEKDQIEYRSRVMGIEPKEYIERLLKQAANEKHTPWTSKNRPVRWGGKVLDNAEVGEDYMNIDVDFNNGAGTAPDGFIKEIMPTAGSIHFFDPISEKYKKIPGLNKREITSYDRSWFITPDGAGHPTMAWNVTTTMSREDAEEYGLVYDDSFFGRDMKATEGIDATFSPNTQLEQSRREVDDLVNVKSVVFHNIINNPTARRIYQKHTAVKEDKGPKGSDDNALAAWIDKETGGFIQLMPDGRYVDENMQEVELK